MSCFAQFKKKKNCVDVLCPTTYPQILDFSSQMIFYLCIPHLELDKKIRFMFEKRHLNLAWKIICKSHKISRTTDWELFVSPSHIGIALSLWFPLLYFSQIYNTIMFPKYTILAQCFIWNSITPHSIRWSKHMCHSFFCIRIRLNWATSPTTVQPNNL